MTHAAYVAAGYGLTAGAVGAYVIWVLRRERVLSARMGGNAAAAGADSVAARTPVDSAGADR